MSYRPIISQDKVADDPATLLILLVYEYMEMNVYGKCFKFNKTCVDAACMVYYVLVNRYKLIKSLDEQTEECLMDIDYDLEQFILPDNCDVQSKRKFIYILTYFAGFDYAKEIFVL